MKKLVKLFLGFLLTISLASCSLFSSYTYDDSSATVVKVSTTITEVVNKVETGCVAVYSQSKTESSASIGSGVIFKKEDTTYYVLTNYHCVEDFVSVSDAEYSIYAGKSMQKHKATLTNYYNSQKDLAVLTFTSSEDFTVISISKDYSPITSVGETVIAIGCPISLNYYNTVTTGVVSKAEYNTTNNNGYENVIQHSAPINPGNSGGGLFNLNGELIGINFKKSTYTYEGQEKIVVDAINYAIALSEVKTFLGGQNLI